ncbi:carboxymuconolactone decarboxylase [Ruegeria marisrubri]|uniref:Carboxymuconolactone decarboxylase n=1 Tax=Ruegeria marisrubri TaxID=1685379 RepID=A0A0X3U7N3_9RHOB|nr:carboxymuconolactone decarboxylase family protein [Ruegeria marisrubri]KUJ84093.1 carboxymuconolactone decarboxylase [Ruegeria marisrubri]
MLDTDKTDITFTYHTKDTAPEASKPLIDQTVAEFGGLISLHALFAESPVTYETYQKAFDLFLKHSSFTLLETQVVFMTSNFINRCHYCMAGHTMMMKRAKMPDDVIDGLREGRKLADPKLAALQSFARELLEKRGHIGDDRLQAFLDAGYDRKAALEVLTGLAAKLISNFTNALAHTRLDRGMDKYAWVHPDDR